MSSEGEGKTRLGGRFSDAAQEATRRKAAAVDDLVIANFQTKHMDPSIRSWKEAHPVLDAMSCDRQIWLGTRSDFADFPFPDGRGQEITVLKGKDAYNFMLLLLTGLRSKNDAETNIKGQVLAAWKNFEKDHPAKARELNMAMDMLNADSRNVASQITVGIQPTCEALIAKNLAGIKKGDQILIVGSLNRHGEVSEFTMDIARKALSQASRVRSIKVAHPDPKVAEKIQKELQKLAHELRTGVNVKIRPWANVTESQEGKLGPFNKTYPPLIESRNAVFWDIPMDSMPEQEEIIREAWRNRVRRDNSFVHVRGDPQNRGMSNEAWANAHLQGYVSPETIREKRSTIFSQNKLLEGIAKKVIDLITDQRAQGENVSLPKVREYLRLTAQ